jgi:carbonic anhydrase
VGLAALAAAVARLTVGAHVMWPGPSGMGSSDGGGPLAMPPATELGAVVRAARAAGVILGVDLPERQAPSTPGEALAELVAGNERYVRNRNEAHTIEISRHALAAGQAPFAAILRCADSRVAPEICFDQPLGRLFVCGVAGNIPTPEVVASLEYGVAILGTQLIVVMGHSACGAIGSAIKYRDDTSVLPGSLPMLIDQIVATCARGVDPESPEALAQATVCNANQGVDELMKRSPVIAEAVQLGRLRLVAGVQDLATGKFQITRK